MKISPSNGYIPSTKDVRADYSETYEGTSERRYAKFDRWLAEVERAAAERAWDECLDEVSAQGTVQLPDNPYRGGKR